MLEFNKDLLTIEYTSTTVWFSYVIKEPTIRRRLQINQSRDSSCCDIYLLIEPDYNWYKRRVYEYPSKYFKKYANIIDEIRKIYLTDY